MRPVCESSVIVGDDFVCFISFLELAIEPFFYVRQLRKLKMLKINGARRNLLKAVGVAAICDPWPHSARSQGTQRIRMEWRKFTQTAQYNSFLHAISSMRENKNPADQGSLLYWANVHQNYCPHGLPYFVSWHRGYLYYFEQQLRISAGDQSLNLPYWDYYSYATLPTEFTDSSPSNPLYVARASVNVYNALDMSPFASTVYNFQRGTTNSFEPKIEAAPHNPVHDLIGGIMSTMQSPLDPIFYLHHASIDRLTHAWALPDGKGIPYTAYPYSSTNSSPYWAGSNIYAPDLGIERFKTCDPTWLGYDYSNDNLPPSLPALAVTASNSLPSLDLSQPIVRYNRPPISDLQPVLGIKISPSRQSLGGVQNVLLSERSVTVRIRLDNRSARKVERVVLTRSDPKSLLVSPVISSILIVFDGLSITDRAKNGGYFYYLFLNMPDRFGLSADKNRHFLGTLGAYQVAAASHHSNAKIEYDSTELLLEQKISDYTNFDISLIRVDGDFPPIGNTIGAVQARIELLEEDIPVYSPTPPVPPVGWYS